LSFDKILIFFEVYKKNRIIDGDIPASYDKLELKVNEYLDNLKIFSILLIIKRG